MLRRKTPSLRAALEAPTPASEPRWLLALLAGTATAFVASVFLSLALIGYGTAWWVVSGVFYAAAALTAAGTHTRVARPVVMTCATIAALSLISAVLGGMNTTLVANRPVAVWSKTAQVQRELDALDASMRVLQRADELLVLDAATARARVDDITSMRARTRDLAAALADASSPTEATDAARSSIARAADAAAQALDGKAQLALQYDARLETEVSLLRETVIAETLQGAQFARQAAAEFGIQIGVRE